MNLKWVVYGVLVGAVICMSFIGCAKTDEHKVFAVNVLDKLQTTDQHGQPYFWLIVTNGKYECNAGVWSQAEKGHTYSVEGTKQCGDCGYYITELK